MTTPLLSAEGLRVSLGGAPVLRDVSLEVSEGEVLGVFGPSGAGKSTLFRALTGEERVASGRVLLFGEDVTELPLFRRARLGLGYLPQTPSVLWDLTVKENLAVFQALGSSGPSARGRDLVEALGLGERLDVRASSLSGGERRRLELVRALSVRPRVLVCDEPFAAIDPLGAEAVREQLARLAAEGGAVILADHHVALALGLCHRAALLLEGEIALITRGEDFCEAEQVRRYYGPPASISPSRA